MARHQTTERTRRRCRLGGAIFVAAAVLPWVALTPGAQADPGSGNNGQGQPMVNICHATDSDTNPYTFQQVSAASVDLEGHLAHRTDPNKIWKTDTLWNGVVHAAGSPKPDLIADYDGHVYDGDITKDVCESKGGTPTATVTVTAPPVTTTVTAPPVTTTVTAPPVTTTVTQSPVTTTVTQPAVTETVTAPPVTTTVTETQTVTAPPVTTTVTQPAATETETVTAPPVTTTVTEPPVTETMTVTALPTTVTVTETPSTTTTDSTTTTSTTTVPTTTSSTTTSSTSSETIVPTVLPTKVTNTSVGTTTTAGPSTSDPAEVLGERAELPRTGTNVAKTSALSLLLLTMGVLLLRVSGLRVHRQRKH